MEQDPWAVVSTQPVSAPAPSASAAPDPWAVVSHQTSEDPYAHYGMNAKGKISNRQLQAAKDYDTDKGNFVPNTDTSGDMIDNSYEPSNEALKSVGVDPDAYRGNKSVAIKTALTGGALPQMDHNGNITGGTTGINPVKAVRSAITAIPRAVGGAWNAAVDPVTAQEQQSPVLNNSTGAEAHRGPGLMAKRLLVDPQTAELQKAVGSWQQGNYADAAAHGIGGAVPLVGPLAANVAEGLTSGSGDEQADAIGNLGGALVVPEALSKASDVLPKSVPRSALSKTIKPADPVAFNAAEQSALPQIKQAAMESGQPIKSASDLLTTVDPQSGTSSLGLIDKAKQNVLLDAHESAGPGKTIADLPPDALNKVKQDLSALDTLKQHIQTAQETATTKAAPAEPTAPGIAADVLGTVSPRAAHAMNLAGKASDVFSILKGKRALTPENLDAAVQQTFGNVEPALRGGAVAADVPAKGPYQPVAGDLSVQHQGNIQPPELPHGDATVAPDRPNPAVISSGSTAQPLVTKPAAIGPNAKPATSTAELDSTLKTAPAPNATETAPPEQKPAPNVRGSQLEPAGYLTLHGAEDGETASLMQLAHTGGQTLRNIAKARGLKIPASADNVQIIEKIHDDLSPQEISAFNDAAQGKNAERSASLQNTDPATVADNKEVAQKLYSKADEMQTNGESPYRIRAWRTAAENIETRPTSVKDILGDVNALKQIKGIDSRMAQHIQEVTGQSTAEAPAKTAPQAEPETDIEKALADSVAKVNAQKASGQTPGPLTEQRVKYPDFRAEFNKIPEEEQVKSHFFSKVTDMPNDKAFDAAENNKPSPAVAMTDADGLKAFNDTYGHEAGNALLKAKADALKQVGLEAYHAGGDEFLARGAMDVDLSEKLEKAREVLQNTVIRVIGPDGVTHDFTGADFSHGTGADLATAEQNMYKMKAARKASGDAGERGQFGKIKEIK